MNLFDLMVVLLVVLHGAMGFREGLVKGLVSLAGLFLTVVLLALFAGEITGLAKTVPLVPDAVAVPLAFVVLLVAGIILSAVIGAVLSGMIHVTPLGFVDNGLGTALGILKALFVAAIIAYPLSLAPKSGFFGGQFVSSQFAPGLASLAKGIIPFATRAAKAVSEKIESHRAPVTGAPGTIKNEPVRHTQ